MIKNIYRYVIIACFAIFSLNTNAQISQGGQPYSFSLKLEQPNYLNSDPSEMYDIDSTASKDCNAVEFARFLPLNSQLGDDNWMITSLENGDHIYRMGIQSEGALAIGAYFKDFFLPKGSRLYIYSPDHQQIKGGFSDLNNSKQGFFAAEYVLGDQLVIEYYEPSEVVGQGKFTLFEVLHAYKNVAEVDESKDYGDSGDCEINVNCPEGDGKKNQRDAVLRLLIKNGGSGVWCTGSLVNNTSEDRTPYVLTADHCGKFASDEDMQLWLFYFHYQTWGCGNPDLEPDRKSLRGCEEIASSSNTGELGSDFFMVKLIQDIPETYNPYFLGWNREGSVSQFGYGIHHPQGDVKKISTYSDALQSASYSDGINNGYWEVIWSETVTGHGVTEGGSSGSPIFDEEGYLIGTLTGGQASCNNQDAPDYYGKFSIHWKDNGTEVDEQLMPWLDPLQSGAMKMSGIYLGIDEQELLEQHLFQIRSNPVNEDLQLIFNERSQLFQIRLIDIQGRIIYKQNHLSNELMSIPVSFLPKGIYVVQVQSGDELESKKILKH